MKNFNKGAVLQIFYRYHLVAGSHILLCLADMLCSYEYGVQFAISLKRSKGTQEFKEMKQSIDISTLFIQLKSGCVEFAI